jgi:hypothetical protein
MWWHNMRAISHRSDSLILARASHNNDQKSFYSQVFSAVPDFRYLSPASVTHRQVLALS